MAEGWPDVRRLIGAAGIYAVAGVAQRALSFVLLPVYTRLIDPTEYGMLEVLNAFSSIAFAVLILGLASAINKVYHRDCASPQERATLLGTALLIDLPVLLVGTGLLCVFAGPLSTWILGRSGGEDMVPLIAVSGALAGMASLVLSTLRAQERATAFVVLSLSQFVVALCLNLLLVVGWGWGVRGILWGTLVSHVVSVPVMFAVLRGHVAFGFNPAVVRPLLHFGLAIVPVMLAGWVTEASDRYILRLYRPLDEVAAYGVGYKLGMLIDVAVVWPFQLAWPAFAFAISHRAGHRETYARTLTYLSVVLTLVVLVTALSAEALLSVVVGERYRQGLVVIAPVALGYALSGVQYAVAPPIHLAGKTRLLPLLVGAAALVNLVLNLLFVPRWGMLGAAWSTAAAFLVLAVLTGWLGQRVYPVPYEYARLAKLAVAGVGVYVVASSVTFASAPAVLAWRIGASLLGLPLLLALSGFLDQPERAGLRDALTRARMAVS